TGASVASASAVEGSDPESGRSAAVGALGASDEAVSRVEDEPVVESASEDENVQEDAAPEDESDTLKSWPHAYHALPSIPRRPGRSFATEDTDVTEDTTESTESAEDTNVDVAEDEDAPEDTEDTEDTEDEDIDVAEGDIDEDTEVEDDDVDVEEDVNETDTADDIEDEDEEDFDEVEDFDEDAAVVEVDPEAEPVDDADKPLGLDNLDEVDDKVDTKKRNFLIAGVAVGLVVLVGGFIWPGFFTGGGDDVPPADDQAVVAEETEASDAGDSDMESDLSELYRVGDNITVLVGNKLTEVSIQEFLPAPDGGALAENEGGDLFVVTQSQLDRYAERNPDQFTDRAALIEDEG